jgi:hypothetical protein
VLIERELTVYADEREDRQLFEELPGWFGFFTITLLSQQSQDRVRTRYKCLLSFRSPRFSACGRFHRWSFGWSSFQRVRRTSALRKLDHANDHRRLSRALKRRAWVFKTEHPIHIGATEVCEEYDDVQKPFKEESITSGKSYLFDSVQ